MTSTVEIVYMVEEHYDCDPPELFGHMRFPAGSPPTRGEIVTLRYLDRSPAFDAVVLSVDERRARVVVSRDPDLLAKKELPMVPDAPKIWCSCVGCGDHARVTNARPLPAGWRGFVAARWPRGSGLEAAGSIYLRLCGECAGRMDVG